MLHFPSAFELQKNTTVCFPLICLLQTCQSLDKCNVQARFYRSEKVHAVTFQFGCLYVRRCITGAVSTVLSAVLNYKPGNSFTHAKCVSSQVCLHLNIPSWLCFVTGHNHNDSARHAFIQPTETIMFCVNCWAVLHAVIVPHNCT